MTIRLRTALFIARLRVQVGESRVNPFLVLQAYRGFLHYIPASRLWVCKVFLGQRRMWRVHKNPLVLADHVAEELGGREMVQGEVKGGVKSMALANLIDSRVPEADKVDVYWTRPKYPVVLKTIPDNDLGKQIEQALGDMPGLSDWTLSNNVLDNDLRTEALTQLVRENEEVDPDEVTIGVIMMMALMPPDHEVLGKLSEGDYYDVAVADTSSGAINVHPSGGRVGGSKLEMQSAAASAAAAGCPLLNYEAHPKGREVIKKGKKVRMIVCEPYPIYLKSVAMFGHAYKKHGDIVTGLCHGMSRANGGHLAPLVSFFLEERAFKPHLEWEQFLDNLWEEGLEEDDKASWDATINKWAAVVNAILNFGRVTVHPDNVDDLCQVIAHRLWLPIKYKGNRCYYSYYSVASGNFNTLNGNSEEHISGYQKVSYDIQRHGMKIGTCTEKCYLCDQMSAPREVTQEELSRIVGVKVVGDDALRRRVDLPVTKWVDSVLGTKTKVETKNAFYEQGNAAEFLRVSYGRDMKTYREMTRVFAKLRWGMAKYDVSDFKCALMSASLEIGPNREGHEIIKRLWMLVAGAIEYNEQLQERYGLPVGDDIRPFSQDEVALSQHGVDRVYVDVLRRWTAMV